MTKLNNWTKRVSLQHVNETTFIIHKIYFFGKMKLHVNKVYLTVSSKLEFFYAQNFVKTKTKKNIWQAKNFDITCKQGFIVTILVVMILHDAYNKMH